MSSKEEIKTEHRPESNILTKNIKKMNIKLAELSDQVNNSNNSKKKSPHQSHRVNFEKPGPKPTIYINENQQTLFVKPRSYLRKRLSQN